MANRISESMRNEESRIQAVYAKRKRDPRYSWDRPGYLFEIQERERETLAVLKRNGSASLAAKHILEIGCGTGYRLREFMNWGAQPENIIGVDLLFDRVAEARRFCPETIRIECANAAQLEFPDATFDLVLQSTVFSKFI